MADQMSKPASPQLTGAQAQTLSGTFVPPQVAYTARDLLADIGGFASIIGLILTVWVALNVKSIRSHFFAKARLPAYQKELEKGASRLAEAIGRSNPMEPATIQLELSRLHAHAKSVRRACPRNLRGDVDSLIKAINNVAGAERSKKSEGLWDVYTKAQTCATSLRNHVEDAEWSAQ